MPSVNVESGCSVSAAGAVLHAVAKQNAPAHKAVAFGSFIGNPIFLGVKGFGFSACAPGTSD